MKCAQGDRRIQEDLSIVPSDEEAFGLSWRSFREWRDGGFSELYQERLESESDAPSKRIAVEIARLYNDKLHNIARRPRA